MYKCVSFLTVRELTAFLVTNAIAQTKIVAIYFDGASGQHHLVYAT